MLGIILIFPAAILGLRLAAAKLPEISRRRKFVGRAGLGLATFLTIAGTELAVVPLVVLFAFGAYRGLQMMKYGQGARRFSVGLVMILFTVLAIVNYGASLTYSDGTYFVESGCISTLRIITRAQEDLKAAVSLDANHNKIGEYGTLKQLEEQGAYLERGFVSSGRPRGYRLVLQLSDGPAVSEKQYFLYAVPTDYGDQPISVLSLVRSLRPRIPYARRSFAVDESGVIRARDLGGSRPVTRAEAAKWAPL
jgi:hypothetical protein